VKGTGGASFRADLPIGVEELRSPAPVPALTGTGHALAPAVRPDRAEVTPVAAACPAAPLRVQLNGNQVAEQDDGTGDEAVYGRRSEHETDGDKSPPESALAGNHMIKMTDLVSSVHRLPGPPRQLPQQRLPGLPPLAAPAAAATSTSSVARLAWVGIVLPCRPWINAVERAPECRACR
jgi:hypothetical protein